MKKIINDCKLEKTMFSYIGSTGAILKSIGMWKEDLTQLMGDTGAVFHFIIHETVCPSSVTVYDWNKNHQRMMDRIGVCTKQIVKMEGPSDKTYVLYQQEALKMIKESINDSKPVLIWAPTDVLEFGIITGYDDSDQVFIVMDCISGDPDPILYTNIGISEVPILYNQFFVSSTLIPKEERIKHSLQYGIQCWNRESSDRGYGIGKGAYKNLINALTNKNYDLFGLAYIIAVYQDVKNHLASYISSSASYSSSFDYLNPVIPHLTHTAHLFKSMTEIVPFQNSDSSTLNPEQLHTLKSLVHEAYDSDSAAMDILAKNINV